MTVADDKLPVEIIYRAAETGDVAAIEAVFAEDIVLYEPVHHPAVLADREPREEPGIWRGRANAIAGVAKVFGALQLVGVDLHSLLADGKGTVAGVLDVKGRDKHGQPYSMPLVEVFKVAGGKVTEIRAYYFDIAQMNTLLRAA